MGQVARGNKNKQEKTDRGSPPAAEGNLKPAEHARVLVWHAIMPYEKTWLW